jgi:AMMECR1 domain-containing protein
LSVSIEQEINRSVSLLSDMKFKIANLTSGMDVKQLKLEVIRDLSMVASEVFLPQIPMEQRGEVLNIFKKKLKEYSEKI